MKPEEFIYWLEGFLENLDTIDARRIKEKLKEIKVKEPIEPAQWPNGPTAVGYATLPNLLKD